MLSTIEILQAEKVKIAHSIEVTQGKIDDLTEKIREQSQMKQALHEKNRDIDIQIWKEKERVQKELEEAAKVKELEDSRDEFSRQKKELEELAGDLVGFQKAHEYQIEDIIETVQAYKNGRNGMLNANDMGMGKTLEASVTLYILQQLFEKEHGRKPKTLLLTKKSLVKKGSTAKEIKRWFPECKIVVALDGVNASQRDFLLTLYHETKADIMLANYEFVRTTKQTHDWDIVIIDEVHKLKGGANSNGPTAIWKACKDICHKAAFTLMLSGTPMVNAPEEMWSYLHIFHPEKFPSTRAFKRDFMDYKTIANEFKLVVDANKILKQALKGQMIRRGAAEVGLQIPPLNYEIVLLERTPLQDKAYKQMEQSFFVWLDMQEDKPLSAMAVIAQLTRLRQINVWGDNIKFKSFELVNGMVTQIERTLNIKESAKIDETMELIQNINDQVVVYSNFNEPMTEIQRRCKELGLRCEIISGSVNNNFDEEAEFQQGKIDVLCLNSSMGEGLNLQKNPAEWTGGSRYGIMLDRWWSPGRNEQCVKRIQRQGGTEPVFIYELQTEPSVDQFIQAKNEEKSEQFASIMESDVIRPASDWKAYFKGLASS
jgi:SNF2 family DNA or RNA helicase